MPVLLGQGERSVEDAVSYAVTHRVRIEIRAILNEGTRSQDELAKLVQPPVGSIGHHLRELLADGSIELACVKQVRNANKYFYRAVEMPFYTDEEIAAMPPAARQAVTGVALQAIMVEAISPTSRLAPGSEFERSRRKRPTAAPSRASRPSRSSSAPWAMCVAVSL